MPIICLPHDSFWQIDVIFSLTFFAIKQFCEFMFMRFYLFLGLPMSSVIRTPNANGPIVPNNSSLEEVDLKLHPPYPLHESKRNGGLFSCHACKAFF